MLCTALEDKVQKDLEMCSRVMANNTVLYNNFVSRTLAAWDKFVPHSTSKFMLPSNCWHTKTLHNVNRNVIESLIVDDFFVIPQKFPDKRIIRSKDLNTMLHTNFTVKFEEATNNGNQSGEVFCLPSVYMVGFPKCGTTTLYDQLASHPDFEEPLNKEGQFWMNFVKAPNQVYSNLDVLLYTYRFKAAAKSISQSKQLKVTMDASTKTVYEGARMGDALQDMCLIPFLLHKVMPNTKIIVTLRNPTKRQWSHYWFYYSIKVYNFESKQRSKNGHPPVPVNVIENASEMFHDHTVASIKKFNDCIQREDSEFKCAYSSFDKDETSVGVSLYYFHIIKWLSVLPKEQFLFLRMEDLAEDQYSVASSAWEFMGLPPISRSKYRPRVSNANKWITSSKYKDSFKMWPKTKELLDTFYRPYNEQLAKLLNDKRFLWT